MFMPMAVLSPFEAKMITPIEKVFFIFSVTGNLFVHYWTRLVILKGVFSLDENSTE
jgi:hypothetical protein